MPTRVILTSDIESQPQQLIPNLKPLQEAAKPGVNAIERGQSLALHTNQAIVDFA